MLQNSTMADNEWSNKFTESLILFYATNVYTFTKSASTDKSYLEARQRNLSIEGTTDLKARQHDLSIEGTTVPTPIDQCSMAGRCNFTLSMKHQFCHCDQDCHIYHDCCVDNKKPAITGSKSQYSPYYICYKGHNTASYEGYFAVDSCPTRYGNETDILLCNEHNIAANGPSVVNPEGVVFKNRHCALCHGISDTGSFDVLFTLEKMLLHGLMSRIENLSKSEKIEHMMLYFSFKEIAPKHFVPRPCILNTIEQNNSLCQSYINPVYQFKRGKSFVYRNYFCTTEKNRDLTDCLGILYDRLTDERFTIHPNFSDVFIQQSHDADGQNRYL